MAPRARLVRRFSAIFFVLTTYAGCKGGAPPANDPAAAASTTTGDGTGTEPSAATERSSGNASSAEGPMPTACKKDAECMLSTFSGCCTCCPRSPHALLRTALTWHEARCAKVDCPPCSTPCGPEPAMNGYTAQCLKDACVAVPE